MAEDKKERNRCCSNRSNRRISKKKNCIKLGVKGYCLMLI